MIHPTLHSLEKIKTGTCAWSYEDWREVFYPEHLPPGERLPVYARHFQAVEVDSTFYATPSVKTVQHWAEATPPGFTFTCKLPREITHERRLRDCAGPLEDFLQSLRPLGEKLGCVLIQLPPSFRPRTDGLAFRDFIRDLPSNVRFAVEFRDHDWHQPRTLHLLEEHRVCWAWTDVTALDHQQEGAFEFLPETAGFVYLRLLGDLEWKYGADGKQLHTYSELKWPRDRSLENWATRLRQRAAEGEEIFAFSANHFEGFAPRTAERLSALLEIPVLPFPETAAEITDAEQGQMPLL